MLFLGCSKFIQPVLTDKIEIVIQAKSNKYVIPRFQHNMPSEY